MKTKCCIAMAFLLFGNGISGMAAAPQTPTVVAATNTTNEQSTNTAPRNWDQTPTPELRQAAGQGDARAQFTLGRRYEVGSSMPRDYAEAARLYRLAAEQGHAMAQNNLGHLYQQGWGVPQDEKEAFNWYRKSAEQGEPYGQANLGWLYAYGRTVERNREQAEHWAREAADQGFVQAQFLMGELFARQETPGGGSVPGNYQVASEWYQKAAAQGHVQAMFCLGEFYYYGKLGYNYPEAIKWFRQAAERGKQEAVMRLGELYRDNHEGFSGDHAEAVRWFRMAADKENAEAQYQLACLLLEGRNIPHDPTEAEHWLNKAARNGYAEAAVKLASLKKQPPESALNQVNRGDLEVASYRGGGETRLILGRSYEEGLGGDIDLPEAAEKYWQILNLGPEKDQEEAARWVINLYAQKKIAFNPKAAYGPKNRDAFASLVEGYSRLITSPEAQSQIGELFLQSDLLPLDKPAAVQWLTRAAKSGSAAAMNRLGELWAAGLSGQPDSAEAVQWYRRAVTNGSAVAQFNLANAYQKGEGIPADPIEAAAWFSLAASHEIAGARDRLTTLQSTMTPAQKEKAKLRAEELGILGRTK